MPIAYTAPKNDPEFEAFWRNYPRKQNKGDARKAWEQTKEIRPATDRLVKALIAQKSTPQWIDAGGKFIPYPASWLRGERWEDSSEIELDGVVNGKMWWESTSEIEKRAKGLGMEWDSHAETFVQFAERVRKAVDGPGLRAVA
jgi:hypothetical protein